MTITDKQVEAACVAYFKGHDGWALIPDRVKVIERIRIRAAIEAAASVSADAAQAVALTVYDIDVARCGAQNLPMYADEIDCQDATTPCDNCYMCRDTGAFECSKSERGECSNDRAEELREVAKLLARVTTLPLYTTAPPSADDTPLIFWDAMGAQGGGL